MVVGAAKRGEADGRKGVVVVGSDDSQRRVFTQFQTPPNTAWGTLT